MGKLLQINPVIKENTSTGRIMRELSELAKACGWESYAAFSGGRDKARNTSFQPLPVGGKLSVIIHAIATRVFDAHGLASWCATKRFIKKIKQIKPDIIHIHNIHGYFLNYKILFKYLKESKIPVVWSIHDCWLFTGHCYSFQAVGCEKWKSGCGECPQKRAFPASYLFDRSAKNYRDKKEAFTTLSNITFVAISKWMRNELKSSFLSSKQIEVIHNGIDLELFKPSENQNIKEVYGFGNRHVILGIASIWLKEKGFDDFIKLSEKLSDNEVIVMVGRMTAQQKQALPQKIITIPRTSDAEQLAQIYSCATAVVNATWQDNYPTINLEAIACGTPVITYKTGGSVESISPKEHTGHIVERGDIDGIVKALREIETIDRGFIRDCCRDHAIKNFGKRERYMEYIELYNKLKTEI